MLSTVQGRLQGDKKDNREPEMNSEGKGWRAEVEILTHFYANKIIIIIIIIDTTNNKGALNVPWA